MDSDGFIYFKGRSKRMIITSGYNVYPAQLENILDACDQVQMSCVIGVPDSYKMQRVKAFVMLKPGVPAIEETRKEIMAYAAKHIAKYAMPKEIEFRDELPKTLCRQGRLPPARGRGAPEDRRCKRQGRARDR